MTINDLDNTKIYLSSKPDRIKLQEKLYELGIYKFEKIKKTNIDNFRFYYIIKDSNLTMRYYANDFENEFMNINLKEISFEDVMNIGNKYNFNPFDKVLVRSSDTQKWKPRFFSTYDYHPNSCYKYGTTDGIFYLECIPYNESLANTNLRPEELYE